KLTSRCQLTLPREIRQKLGVKEGDKVVFIEENGRVFIENAEKLKFAPDEHSGGKE
ncbi:AbrB/MazE/SpoVT family DNA-binding domain-containing protein, partial [Desulfovibrio sp. SGI.169]|uniref:AbrB/MazE/SpoVT family DNA-binding domain-containing protein n=1 Tax=Desulfovibrio sp. SGI.169 TaxID=3420561 RepID=UPI003CFF39FE